MLGRKTKCFNFEPHQGRRGLLSAKVEQLQGTSKATQSRRLCPHCGKYLTKKTLEAQEAVL